MSNISAAGGSGLASTQRHQMSQLQLGQRRREIYRYTASEQLYTLAWSNKAYADKRFRMAAATILDENHRIMENKLFVIELDEAVGDLVLRYSLAHGYPPSAINFIPSADPQSLELLATVSDHLRIYRYDPDKRVLSAECDLHSTKSQAYSSPLTCLDWNEVDISLVGTASIDTTATIWNIEVGKAIARINAPYSLTKPSTSAATVSGSIRTQLIAHDKPVHGIAFSHSVNGRNEFGTAGADGSVRLFDLRSLQHSTILYEDNGRRALNHLSWNRTDPTKVATVAHEAKEVVVLDVRVPCRPFITFNGHQGSVNGIAWAPHSEYHLCTAGSDNQALIWQTNHFSKDEPILAYSAEGAINQIHWASNLTQWICICFDNHIETLRV